VSAQTASPNVYMSGNVTTGNGTGSGGTASAARVQSRHAYFANTSVGAMVLAYSSSNTAGNLLVTFASYNRTGPRIPSVSDSQGNTWQVISPSIDFTTVGDNVTMYAAYAMNCAGGPNTVTWSDGTGNGFGDSGLEILEYSGIVTTNALDGSFQKTATIGSPTRTPITDSFTLNQRDLVLVCFADEHTPQSSVLAGSGYTTIQSDPGHIDAEAEILGIDAGSKTASWVLSNPSETWSIQVMAFKIR